jgi:hypothetical protein
MNSVGSLFGPRPRRSGPTQRPQWPGRPKPTGTVRERSRVDPRAQHAGGGTGAGGGSSTRSSQRARGRQQGGTGQTFTDGVSPCGSVDGGAARAPMRDGDGGVPLTAMVVATGGSRRINGKGGVLGRLWSALEAEILCGMEVAVVELSTA